MTTPPWAPRSVAVLGGDAREPFVIDAYLEFGCEVRTFGVPAGSAGSTQSSPNLAVEGVDVIVAPVPGIGAGDVLYAPTTPEPIVVDAGLLGAANHGAVFFSGRATPTIESAGAANGIRFVHLYDDDELQIRHALPTAEGAIARIVERTDDTIAGSSALVTGYGRIGKVLAERLRGMGARVTIAARRGEERAHGEAMGCEAVDFEQLAEVLPTFDLVCNTAPALIFDRARLGRVSLTAFLLDLAAPPGGIDREAADELGLHHDWARGQAGTAPRHSGLAQFEAMSRNLTSLFGG